MGEVKKNPDRSAPTGEPVPMVASPELDTPKNWALATGNAPKLEGRKSIWSAPSGGMSRVYGSVAHEVAAVLHGWREHEHHAGSPMLMSKEDYLAALKAAMPEEGNPVPHKPVLSPHKGGGVKVTFKG